MQSSVLITGGTGYIGSHTVVELLKSGKDVVIVDNLYNSNKDIIDKIEKISGKKVKFYEADIRHKFSMDEIFRENNFESVIHFAGLKAVGESVKMPLAYYENNIYGTMVLLEVMKEHNVKKLIFSSSATVYGDPKTLPIDENSPLPPSGTSPYGSTKLFIEYMLKDLAVSDSEWNITLLRYFNPVGAHESALLGEDPKGIPNNLTPYIARVASGALESVNVFGIDYNTPDGTGVRDYIHVVDLANGHVKALEKMTEKGVHIYNLGTGIGYSVLDVIKAFSKACGRELPYKICPRREGDIATCYAKVDKAKAELGFEAKFSLDDMCSSLWKFQQNLKK